MLFPTHARLATQNIKRRTFEFTKTKSRHSRQFGCCAGQGRLRNYTNCNITTEFCILITVDFRAAVWYNNSVIGIICECAGIGRQARLRGVCLWRTGSSPVTRTISSVHNGFELWTLVFYINCFLSYMYRAGFIPLFCFMQFGCIFDRNTH